MLSKVFVKAAVYMGIVLFTASCQEEVITPNVPVTTATQTNGGSNPAAANDSFFAKVDGVDFQETLLYASDTQTAGSITITASENASFPSIGLEFPSDITPGTYPFSGYLGSYRGLYNLGTNFDQMFYAEGASGDLVITNHDVAARLVEGTFSFTAVPVDNTQTTPTYAITEGAFSVSY